jgi:hypothetical protein
VIAFINEAEFLVFPTWALVEGGAGKTAVPNCVVRIWTLLLAQLFPSERIRGPQWITAICTLTGLTLTLEPWTMPASPLSKLLGRRHHHVQAASVPARSRPDVADGPATADGYGAIASGRRCRRPIDSLVCFVHRNPGIHINRQHRSVPVVTDRLPRSRTLPGRQACRFSPPVVALLSSRLLPGEEFHVTEISETLMLGEGTALLSLIGGLASPRSSARSE